MTFKTEFEKLLEQLAELHQREVEDARRKTSDVNGKRCQFAYEPGSSEESSEELLLSGANAMVPVELTDSVRFADEVVQTFSHGALNETEISLDILGDNAFVEGNEMSEMSRDRSDTQSSRSPRHREQDWVSENGGALTTPQMARATSEYSFDVVQESSPPDLLMSMGQETKSLGKQAFRTREPWIFEPWMHRVNLMEKVLQDKSDRKDSLQKLEDTVPSIIEIKEAERRRRYILLPDSKYLTAWMTVCFMLLLYDMIVLPIDLCFSMQATSFQQGMDVLSASVWTVDMVLAFFTGVWNKKKELEVRLAEIRRIYMKSWFPFDIILLVSDWASLIITITGSVTSGHSISMLRFARVRRVVNIIRVARILRLSKLRTLLRRSAVLMHMPKTYVQLTNGWIGVSVVLVLLMHLLSCVWYMLGNEVEDGWVVKNNLGAASVGHLYAISMHWSFSRMHGLASPYVSESTPEIVTDTVLIYMSLILGACYTSLVVTLCMARINANTRTLWMLSAAYSTRHNISPDVHGRVLKFLESLSCAGAREVFQEEEQLLLALPSSLKKDLLFEARVPFLLAKPFLSDSYFVNARVVFHICIDAIQVRVFSEDEVIFAHGDHCHGMLFLTDGRLSYLSDINAHSGLGRRQVNHVPMLKVQNEARRPQLLRKSLETGSSISEAVLWTKWTHMWRLVASVESETLILDPEAFAASISGHEGPALHAIKYARRFVKCLNSADELDDLVVFDDLRIEHLDDAEEAENAGNAHAHFMFLSHYKVEAGTEATLMRDLLNDMLSQNPNHPAHDFLSPIFVDSEDLTDLAELRQHVEMTTAFVLLLTPGVLSRPWCLVEIVTAVEHNVEIVLVDIQRPGSRYSYPDDAFYADLLEGKFLPQGSIDLLQNEGITLADVENAIRQIFLKISLPFSPHKTKTIREAEILDILKRCGSGKERQWAMTDSDASTRRGRTSSFNDR